MNDKNFKDEDAVKEKELKHSKGDIKGLLKTNFKHFVRLIFDISSFLFLLGIPMLMLFGIYSLGEDIDKRSELIYQSRYIQNGLFADESVYIEVHSKASEDPVFYVKTKDKHLLVSVTKNESGSYSESIKEIE